MSRNPILNRAVLHFSTGISSSVVDAGEVSLELLGGDGAIGVLIDGAEPLLEVASAEAEVGSLSNELLEEGLDLSGLKSAVAIGVELSVDCGNNSCVVCHIEYLCLFVLNFM